MADKWDEFVKKTQAAGENRGRGDRTRGEGKSAIYLACEFLCFAFTDAQKVIESITEGNTSDEPKHKTS